MLKKLYDEAHEISKNQYGTERDRLTFFMKVILKSHEFKEHVWYAGIDGVMVSEFCIATKSSQINSDIKMAKIRTGHYNYMCYLLGQLTQDKFDVKKPIALLADYPQILSRLAREADLQNIEYKFVSREADGYYNHIFLIYH